MVLLDHFANKSNTFLSLALPFPPISSLGLPSSYPGYQDTTIKGSLVTFNVIYFWILWLKPKMEMTMSLSRARQVARNSFHCKKFNDFDFLSRSSYPFWTHIHTPAQFVNAWFICLAWTLYLAEFIFVNVVLSKSKNDSYLFIWHLSDSGLGRLRNTHCSKSLSGLFLVFNVFFMVD